MGSEPPAAGPGRQVMEAPGSGEASAFELITDTELSYLSLENLLAELLDRIRGALGADTAAILLLDQERNVLLARAARGIEEEVRQGVQIPVGLGFAGRIAAGRRPVRIEDVDHADILNPLLRQVGIRSLMGAPLMVAGRVIGVLHVGTLVPRKFTDDDERVLQLAADRAALVIDNARSSEQRSLTEALQRVLLPEALPQIPGLSLSAKYVPADQGLKVGGDWFDVFMLEDGRVALVAGDVVGQGIAAAAVMAEVRTAARAYSMERADPFNVVMMLNSLLLGLGRKRSSTMLFMALDLETEKVTAVNAGHPPALLLDPDRQPSFVTPATGPPLGVSWGARYEEQTFDLLPGSSLVLYTDGLIERRGEDIDSGLARLTEAAMRPVGPGEGMLADALFNRIAQQMDLEDDVALLAVEASELGNKVAFDQRAHPAVLAGMRRVIARWLTRHGVDDQDVFDVSLAVSEAAANAIEHAYGPADAMFRVECEVGEGQVMITVTDAGTWRPLGRRERGRGLDIMGKLMDELQVQRTPTGTRIRMIKRVGKG